MPLCLRIRFELAFRVYLDHGCRLSFERNQTRFPRLVSGRRPRPTFHATDAYRYLFSKSSKNRRVVRHPEGLYVGKVGVHLSKSPGVGLRLP